MGKGKIKSDKGRHNIDIVYFLCVLIPIICVILAGCFFYFSVFNN